MTMDREETLVDMVERLDRSIRRLETLVEGDQGIGLYGLTARVVQLEHNVDELRSVKVSALQWLLGYLLFGAFVFLVSYSGCNWLGIPLQVGFALGLFFFGLAALFFVSGLGWIKWR